MLCHYDQHKKIADYEVFPMGFFSKTPKMPGYPAAPGASMGMPSPYPLGHAPPHVRQHAAMMMKGVMRDLNSLKQAGMLSPQHMMIERWCDTLGRALEPMTIIGGPMKGLMDWMMEVQFLTAKIKERVYARNIPLNPSERTAIAGHAGSWLAARGGGCDTGDSRSGGNSANVKTTKCSAWIDELESAGRSRETPKPP